MSASKAFVFPSEVATRIAKVINRDSVQVEVYDDEIAVNIGGAILSAAEVESMVVCMDVEFGLQWKRIYGKPAVREYEGGRHTASGVVWTFGMESAKP